MHAEQLPRTLVAASEALAGGQSAVGYAEGLLARVDAVEADVHGFVTLDRERVLAAAAESDARRAAGQARSPLDGVPIAIKDNISVGGEPCSCASKLLQPYQATYDAGVVERLKSAGMIPFGRANMDEYAMGSTTENSCVGATSNPWNLNHVPGGSSGGSAAVVAAGEVPAALGSDTGGSIRQPASFCGVVGMKPTYGRVSRYGLVAYASSLDQIGPVANSVADCATLLGILCGHDGRDCTSLPDAAGSFDQGLDQLPAGTRIGLPREFLEVDGLQDEVRQAIEQTRAALQDAGCEIVDVSLPLTRYAVASYYIIATAEASSNLARFEGIRYGARDHEAGSLMDTYFQTREKGFGDEVKRRIMLGTYVLSSGYYDAYYLRAQKVRTLIRQDYQRALQQCDALLAPVSPTTAFAKGEMSDPLQVYLADIYTIPANLSGICGISVPVGRDHKGLPIGAQLIGGAMQEHKLLQVASAVERAFINWRGESA